MQTDWWAYDNLPSGEPYRWDHTNRGTSPWANQDFHLDIGCGTLKKGRLGIDRHVAPGVDLAIDLETLLPFEGSDQDPIVSQTHGLFIERTVVLERAEFGKLFPGVEPAPDEFTGWPVRPGLPFPDGSIESIISHHCMEHLLHGFLPLMDECHRVLKPGGVLYVITPLFPSRTAMEDPDHKRMILEGTFETFVGNPDGSHWHEDFSVPYTSCRFEMLEKDMTSIEEAGGIEGMWGPKGAREIRVALRKRDL